MIQGKQTGDASVLMWFKRDLSVFDNVALTHATQAGTVIPVYILEPELWQQPDMSHRHFCFLQDSLADLSEDLCALGQGLVLRIGEPVSILADLHEKFGFTQLCSHQETWNGWTYARDQRVLAWCQNTGVTWHQPRRIGVTRGLNKRAGWAKRWQYYMAQPCLPAPTGLKKIDLASDPMPRPEAFLLAEDGCIARQSGGRRQGLKVLESFLHRRGEDYSKAMSSPLSAAQACSRLSAHLAFGTVSMREVHHALQARRKELAVSPRTMSGNWPKAFSSFSSRLHWHCHFIQKLEDEPRIEFENMHPAYNKLRQEPVNEAYLTAWQQGQTGYPMVDACMRSLIATGWLNFRMRAMLMSFASYHLWLHWRLPALHLARQFTDYEPGIHYAQAQMQSGTTGINTIRIYNPIKQSLDQDPNGLFIKRWVPELRDMPVGFIHQPWRLPEKINGYPMPIVEEKAARQAASAKLYALRKPRQHALAAQHIVDKHGSRKSGIIQIVPRSKPKKDPRQDEFIF